MSEAFDPDEIAELETRFKRVEQEATTALCLYIEMPYDEAAELVRVYRSASSKIDLSATQTLLEFLIGILDSLEDTLAEAGLDPDA